METAIVSIALSTIRDFVAIKAKFLYGLQGEMETLQRKLEEIECLLDDAESRHHETKSVKYWLTQIRYIAHRAEDVILMYAVRVSSRRGRTMKQRLRRFSCILKECGSIHQISSEISEIKSHLVSVTQAMDTFNQRNIMESSSTVNINDIRDQWWPRITFPSETEDCFVGREKELLQLESLVEQHRFIALWGNGGIGKTTIVRKVYKHFNDKRYFERFAWVCVTQRCQTRDVLEDVLKQLVNHKRKHTISSLTDTDLMINLVQIQSAKKCIIVLDDVWKVDHWDALKPAFLVQNSKSKILLTTRNQNVANMVYVYEVGLLTLHDGWELLKKKAFLHNIVPAELAIQGSLLEKIGKKMVHRCSYLPLVISLLGGVLSCLELSVKEWERVNQNIKQYLYKNRGIDVEKEIHGVLKLSYDELPYYLKPCFLFMGRFMEGETIGVNDLYRLWISHGMVSLSHGNQENDETIMDTAELYLKELVSRCVVQVEAVDAFEGQIYATCKLHDVMRELCLSIGAKEKFGLKILEYEGGRFRASLHKCLSDLRTRYLAVVFSAKVELEADEGAFTIHRDMIKCIRSLSFYNAKGIDIPHSMFAYLKYFTFLRVLIFEDFIFPQRKLPKGICHLVLLRFLRLRACILDELPSLISNLVYLCTLDLSGSKNVRVPNVLKKMPRLKHLFLPLYDLKEVKKVQNYRLMRLDEGLDELETLVGIDSSVHELKHIARMKNLRRVSSVVRDNESLSAILNAITTSCKKLRCLGLTIKQDCQFEGVTIWNTVMACSNLHRLAIDVRIGKVVEESRLVINGSKLLGLTLHECEIEEDPMEIFEKLPFLKELRLLKSSFVGKQMTCHALGFRRLKMLTLSGLPELKEWRVEKKAMPLVSEIEISHCPHLKMVPDGLKFIGTLQKLKISGMHELGNRVLSSEDGGVEGEDFDKVRHVPSIVVCNDQSL